MVERRRVNLKGILADSNLRRELMVPTIQAIQAREGIDTSREQAERAYYVVTESDKASFFDLDRFKGGRRAESDRREEIFVQALHGYAENVRVDVARRDFGTIGGSPLSYRRVGLVSHVFREAPSLDPSLAVVKQGLATSEDPRWVRFFWEVNSKSIGPQCEWAPFAKGGGYSRFYSDVYLVVYWAMNGRALKDYVIKKEGSESKRIYSQEWYFKPGLTWPLRTQRGFNLRIMPEGCIFGHKGPGIFPKHHDDTWFLLGLANSAPAEYLLKGLMSFGSWEVGVIKRLPVPQASSVQRETISAFARQIHDAKAAWDTGNETSTRFTRPWLLQEELAQRDLPSRLDHVAEQEASQESLIQALYAQLNDEAYKLYGISAAHRAEIEATMGDRPPEVLWVAMERKDAAQKRMEHVCRLLSYAIKRVLEADDDGIVPFQAVAGEPALIDRLRIELHQLFPQQDPNALEVALTNELKRRAKCYRSVSSLEEWLNDVFFDYHESLYKSRPILWHIASSQGRGACAFGALVSYHTFDYERLAKLRGTHLRDAIAHCRREAGLASKEGRTDDRLLWQSRMEDSELLDQRLQWLQEGANGHPAPGDCRIRTPWKAEADQPQGWRPDLDDGVVVNIAPLQVAGVLRTAGGPG
jgi:hypothetical protein